LADKDLEMRREIRKERTAACWRGRADRQAILMPISRSFSFHFFGTQIENNGTKNARRCN
jgi:hypothetical protein